MINRSLNFDKPLLMGILNITPDSFSDGGLYHMEDKAINRAKQMIDAGVDIIDIGGESSGPGSVHVPLGEELHRVIPVIEGVRAKNDEVLISIDTYKAEVAKQALEAGADLINDITACRGDENMAQFVAEKGVPIVLMYSKDPSARTSLDEREYDDVIKTIKGFFLERIDYLKSMGVLNSQIILDPGMGHFISSIPEYSFEIVDRLEELKEMGYSILLGPSRKSFLGGQLKDRLHPSINIALKAIENGANILRMHDVKEARAAIDALAKG